MSKAHRARIREMNLINNFTTQMAAGEPINVVNTVKKEKKPKKEKLITFSEYAHHLKLPDPVGTIISMIDPLTKEEKFYQLNVKPFTPYVMMHEPEYKPPTNYSYAMFAKGMAEQALSSLPPLEELLAELEMLEAITNEKRLRN